MVCQPWGRQTDARKTSWCPVLEGMVTSFRWGPKCRLHYNLSRDLGKSLVTSRLLPKIKMLTLNVTQSLVRLRREKGGNLLDTCLLLRLRAKGSPCVSPFNP